METVDYSKIRTFETDLKVPVVRPVLNALSSWFNIETYPVGPNKGYVHIPPQIELNEMQCAFLRAAIGGNDQYGPGYDDESLTEWIPSRVSKLTPEDIIGNTHFFANLVRDYVSEPTDQKMLMLEDFGLGLNDERTGFKNSRIPRGLDIVLNGMERPDDVVTYRRQAILTRALDGVVSKRISAHGITDAVSAINDLGIRLPFNKTTASIVMRGEVTSTTRSAKSASAFLRKGPNCVIPTTSSETVVRQTRLGGSKHESQLYNVTNPTQNMCLVGENNKMCNHVSICRRHAADQLELTAAYGLLDYLQNNFPNKSSQ